MARLFFATGFALALMTRASVAAEHSEEHFVIALRLPEWKSMHFDDPAKASEHAAAVKRMGAEVRVQEHEGHTDVTYRTDGWKTLRVKTDKLAHEWEDWLKRAGFETLHGHDPDHANHDHHAGHNHNHTNEHAEVVLLRTSDWVNLHVQDPRDVAELVAIAEALRCEVQKAEHGNHVDVRFRCSEWTAVEFPTHEVATAWMKWFEGRGFQVRHEHGAAGTHAGHSH